MLGKRTCKLEKFELTEHNIMDKVPQLTAFSVPSIRNIPMAGTHIEQWLKTTVNGQSLSCLTVTWLGYSAVVVVG